MKKVLFTVFAAAFLFTATFSTANAVDLSPGLQEFGVSGMLDLDAPDGFDLALDFNYGYFIIDNVEVGAAIGVKATDSNLQFSLGPFAEYNLPMSDNFFFALGLHAGFIYADVDDMDMDDSAFNLKGNLGLKYFINQNVAITGGFAVDWASSELYQSDTDELKDMATTITIGTRFYF